MAGTEDFSGVLSALEACAAVKDVERRGWKTRAGISSPESVADHSFATALAAMMIGDFLGMDTLEMVRMALIHDVCEATTGDIQPGEMDGRSKEVQETAALSGLLEALPERQRSSYLEAFSRFNAGTSPEARLVKDLDKLEMVLQAVRYERKGTRGEVLEEFWKTAAERISSPEGRKLLSSASSLRPRR
jgi:putative hydrolase of HD superfamily